MAELIHKLYTRCYPQATFFRPQFDMKRGKYELDTTGAVIQERCGGKAIFLLSEYFFASEVCQFAVSFTAAVCKGAGVGNLIPFHLTPNSEHVPAVLKGISGIRWFRQSTRKYSWQMVTDTILAKDVQQEEIAALYKRIDDLVDSDPSLYLGEVPYEEGLAPPGEPIKIIEPEGMKELLEEQQKAFQDKFASSPPTPLSKRDKIVNAISSFKTKLFKSKSLSDIDQPSNNSPTENSDAEVIYQRTTPSADLTEAGLIERKTNGKRGFKKRFAGLFARKGSRSTSFLSLLGIGEEEAERSEDRHSVQSNQCVMVKASSDRADVNDVNSFDESCQVLASSDLSLIMFKRKSKQVDTEPEDIEANHNKTNTTEVTFLSNSPEENVLPLEECEVVHGNTGADLNEQFSHQNSVDDIEDANIEGVENEAFATLIETDERDDEGFIFV